MNFVSQLFGHVGTIQSVAQFTVVVPRTNTCVKQQKRKLVDGATKRC